MIVLLLESGFWFVIFIVLYFFESECFLLLERDVDVPSNFLFILKFVVLALVKCTLCL